MKASIVTPAFNAAAFIEGCIENVAGQGDAVLEHIIADGGSTDGTLETIARLQRRYPHVRLIPGPDRGQSDAQNKGSDAARGEVISILNADDFYQPGAVAEAVAMLAAMPVPSIVFGDCAVIDEHDRVLSWSRPRRVRPEFLLQMSSRYPLPANPSAYFYHRQVHDRIGGFDVDNRYSMDMEFVFAAVRTCRVRYEARHWGNFRFMAGTKSFENREIGLDPVSAIARRHRRRLPVARRLLYWHVRAYDRACKVVSLVHRRAGPARRRRAA